MIRLENFWRLQRDGLPLGALVAQPLAQLLTPQGGFSTAISRLATIALCAEITQGPAQPVDTAISLSLQKEAWERCQTTARELADVGELHAPKIAGEIIGFASLNQEEDLSHQPTLSAGLHYIIFFLIQYLFYLHPYIPRIQLGKKMMIC